jgi:hypothetical protein
LDESGDASVLAWLASVAVEPLDGEAIERFGKRMEQLKNRLGMSIGVVPMLIVCELFQNGYGLIGTARKCGYQPMQLVCRCP